MGILTTDGVVENFKGISASDRIDQDGRMTGIATQLFDVHFDAANEAAVRPMIALRDSRIPQVGDSHPGDDWTYVLNRSAVVDADSAFLYHVTINYSQIANPFAQRTIFEWLSASTMEPVDTDIDGNPILNSSTEPFDPPIMQRFDDLILRASYNVPNFNPVGAANYKTAVNDAPILIHGQYLFLEGQVKVLLYTSREILMITGRPYIAVTLELKFRHEGWKRKVLDQGYRTKGDVVDGVQQYTPILDSEGNELTEPALLDGNGQELADGLPAVRLEWWTNRRLNFASEFGAFI